MKSILLLTSILLLGITSCTTEDSPEPSIKNAEYTIYIPTVFAPSKLIGMSKNNLFYPTFDGIKDVELTVYDASNTTIYNFIFPSSTSLLGWDGTYEGDDMPTGNYNYRITYTVSSTLEEGVIENSVFLLR